MISEALRLIRVFHDMKQKELAARLGISSSYLSEIETNHKEPSLELLQRYAEVFRMPVSSILFFAEEIPTAKTGQSVQRTIAAKAIRLLKFIEERTTVHHGDDGRV